MRKRLGNCVKSAHNLLLYVMRKFAVAALVLSSCSAATTVGIPAPSLSNHDMAGAIHAWADASISNYRYKFKVVSSDECELPEIVISVKNSTVDYMRFTEEKMACDSSEVYRKNQDASMIFEYWNLTIGSLFARIVEWKDVNTPMKLAFHPDFSFPVFVSFDYPASLSEFVANDFAYSIVEFEIS